MKSSMVVFLTVMMNLTSGYAMANKWVCGITEETNPGEFTKVITSVSIDPQSSSGPFFEEGSLQYFLNAPTEEDVQIVVKDVANTEEAFLGTAWSRSKENFLLFLALPQIDRAIYCTQEIH